MLAQTAFFAKVFFGNNFWRFNEKERIIENWAFLAEYKIELNDKMPFDIINYDPFSYFLLVYGFTNIVSLLFSLHTNFVIGIGNLSLKFCQVKLLNYI